ncbi:MAG: UbiA family prenyltransferase, partial [Paracoccaceae bacterium]|nr:UbiA family prenyltransferase [Paracoccaceae bacterium]
AAFAQSWATPFRCLARLSHGKAALKRFLGQAGAVDVSALPYNEAVLAHIRAWRDGGGRVALVTASDQGLADRIGAHLGLFDEVYGSNGETNLKGANKAAFLVAQFGAGGFDYIGDAEADLPVWAEAGRAVIVAATPELRRKAEATGRPVEVIASGAARAQDYVRALRPHQWMKNLLVFLPMLAGHDFRLQTFGQALLGFIVFSMIASGVYVLNDLLDLAADRAHPRKRNRPLASGAMPILHGTILAPALLLAGLVLAVPLGARFVAVMLGYLILTTAYSLRLKRLLVVDIVALSALYTVRIVAGGAASDIELSVWLLAFSVFFFFSLAAVKRQAELVDNIASGKDKPAGRGYLASDLPLVETMAVGAGFVSVLVMALYLDSPNVRVLYNQPGALWGICMVLLYWISRMVMLGHRGLMDDDPVIFAAKDRVSQVSALVIFAFALMGVLL